MEPLSSVVIKALKVSEYREELEGKSVFEIVSSVSDWNERPASVVWACALNAISDLIDPFVFFTLGDAAEWLSSDPMIFHHTILHSMEGMKGDSMLIRACQKDLGTHFFVQKKPLAPVRYDDNPFYLLNDIIAEPKDRKWLARVLVGRMARTRDRGGYATETEARDAYAMIEDQLFDEFQHSILNFDPCAYW